MARRGRSCRWWRTTGGWFFDTELLLLAEERGLRISEVPVDWIEDLDSRVEILPTALEDVKGLLRVRAQRLRRRVRRPARRPASDRSLAPSQRDLTNLLESRAIHKEEVPS